MARTLGILLCLLALIAQVGLGSLPTGELCLGCTAAPQTRTCCCADDRDDDVAADDCCVKPIASHTSRSEDCNRCIRIRVPDQRSTTALRAPAPVAPDVLLAVLPLPVIEWNAPSTARHAWHAPRATESPPGLALIRTVRLTI